MSKLYHHAGSWQLPGKQDKHAERVDVPNQPEQLAAWLNERAVPAVAGDVPETQLSGAGHETQLSGAGAVISGAELERVNRDRPTFLGPISADEIERRRMAAAQCPKCGNGRSYLHALERLEVESWIQDKATTADLDALAALIEESRK